MASNTNSSKPLSQPLSNKINELATFSSTELQPPSQSDLTSVASFDLSPLSPESLQALRRLIAYKAPIDPYPFPNNRAAVMIPLFSSRNGKNLNVLLSTRSLGMRTYAGNVALPGGRVDDTDINLEATARREAFEEVGLPPSPTIVKYLTTLRPFVARSLQLVTPIVCLILDHNLQPSLNPTEVSQIFSLPLHSFLLDDYPSPSPLSSSPSSSTSPLSASSTSPSATATSTAIAPAPAVRTKPYHTSTDYPWFEHKPHRFHSFETYPRNVIGLTAEILIECGTVAYGKSPDFTPFAPDQLSPPELVEAAMLDPGWVARSRKEDDQRERERIDLLSKL